MDAESDALWLGLGNIRVLRTQTQYSVLLLRTENGFVSLVLAVTV